MIKDVANDLKSIGVIYVDGIAEEYISGNHQFCVPGHTNGEMVDYDTWFWSPYSRINTVSEGPGDPNNPYDAAAALPNPADVLLEFATGKPGATAAALAPDALPWEGNTQYPTFESLMDAMQASDNATVQAVSFDLLRSFHPKGTAYGLHAQQFMAAIADNRGPASAAGIGTVADGQSALAAAPSSSAQSSR